MAISTEGINKVRQKAFNYVRGIPEDPFGWLGLKAFFRWMAEHGGNVDLEFVPFADLTGDTVIADAANKLYVVYAKKQNTATDAFVKLVDHASTAAGTTFAICIELNVGNDRSLLLFPGGLAMSAGITMVSSTTDTGGTDSSSGDGPDGFVILGGP